MLRQTLIFLHLSSAIVWVGGMFFAYFCLRPAVAQVLDPPKRLPLWVATFDRFFLFVAYAVVVIVLSGFFMLFQTGFRVAPLGWQIMMVLGLVMASVFGYIYLILYPKLRAHSAASEWSEAALFLNKTRILVGLNLLLSLCAMASVMFLK